MNNYLFFFVGGSCGCFVKNIFYYYLYKLNQYNWPVEFKISSVTGDCHNIHLPMHCHYYDQLDHSKKIVLIDFDEDDKSTIIKMSFHKWLKFEIAKKPDMLVNAWRGELGHISPTDHVLLEEKFVQNPDYLIFPNWRQQVEMLRPVLTVKFKDILYGDLNNIVANFFETVPLPEVDYYINKYRFINKKYINTGL